MTAGTRRAHNEAMRSGPSRRTPLSWVALALGTTAVAEVAAAAGLTIAVGWSWSDALEAFVVTNSVMGFAFAVCGATIAWHRPRNPVGWLFIGAGLAHATAGVAAPAVQALLDAGASLAVVRAGVTVFLGSWPWSIALFLPLALLLFPDGRMPSRRWRPALLAVVASAPLFVLAWGAGPEPPAPHLPSGYLTLPGYDALTALWTLAELRTLGALALAVVALVVRYRRGDETQRRQLLWLLLATVVVVAVIVPWSFAAGTPIFVLFAIPLIPLAVTVAIVRHQLLDIRLVVSRAVAWVLLSAVIVAAYVLLVTALDRFVSAQFGRSAVATVIIALLAAPMLPRLQRAVDQAMYGDRRNPARVVSRVAEQLVAGPSQGLPGVAAAIRDALRLPYVAVLAPDGGLVTSGGEPSGVMQSLPLHYGELRVGALVVGLRPGEHELSGPDRDVLDLVTVPLAVALHATGLSSELQASRQRIVAAREEERRRLRRDLHDGLGPTLTGVALAADAAANHAGSDVDRARELLASVRADSRAAIADVRRLVDDLRPPALDEYGLVGALRQRAENTALRVDGDAVHVEIDAPPDLPALSAAVEIAAYRIVTEALTNVLRHSRAHHAVVSLRCGDDLHIDVIDDGPPQNGPWAPGVGLHAMRERVDELGGRFSAGPTSAGGRVSACLPLKPA